jgi:hypothetical protein
MLTDFETDSTATAAEIDALRATFDNGGAIDVVAACALLSIEDTTENDRRRAGQPASVAAKPAQPGTLAARPTVTAATRAKVREIRARVNAADARSALLEEIGRKHGASAAEAARGFSVPDLLRRAAAPTRAAIAESWARTFKAKRRGQGRRHGFTKRYPPRADRVELGSRLEAHGREAGLNWRIK